MNEENGPLPQLLETLKSEVAGVSGPCSGASSDSGHQEVHRIVGK